MSFVLTASVLKSLVFKTLTDATTISCRSNYSKLASRDFVTILSEIDIFLLYNDNAIKIQVKLFQYYHSTNFFPPCLLAFTIKQMTGLFIIQDSPKHFGNSFIFLNRHSRCLVVVVWEWADKSSNAYLVFSPMCQLLWRLIHYSSQPFQFLGRSCYFFCFFLQIGHGFFFFYILIFFLFISIRNDGSLIATSVENMIIFHDPRNVCSWLRQQTVSANITHRILLIPDWLAFYLISVVFYRKSPDVILRPFYK